jgi:hypothetical protein
MFHCHNLRHEDNESEKTITANVKIRMKLSRRARKNLVANTMSLECLVVLSACAVMRSLSVNKPHTANSNEEPGFSAVSRVTYTS